MYIDLLCWRGLQTQFEHNRWDWMWMTGRLPCRQPIHIYKILIETVPHTACMHWNCPAFAHSLSKYESCSFYLHRQHRGDVIDTLQFPCESVVATVFDLLCCITLQWKSVWLRLITCDRRSDSKFLAFLLKSGISLRRMCFCACARSYTIKIGFTFANYNWNSTKMHELLPCVRFLADFSDAEFINLIRFSFLFQWNCILENVYWNRSGFLTNIRLLFHRVQSCVICSPKNMHGLFDASNAQNVWIWMWFSVREDIAFS